MSKIHRSLKNVQGDITIAEGDVVITDPSKGLVTDDQLGDTNRLKSIDVGGDVKSVTVDEI